MKWSAIVSSVLAAGLLVAAHATQAASDSAPVTVAQAGQHGDGSMPRDPMAAGAMHRLGDLVVESPWARATAQGVRVGGAFLTVRNAGDRSDRLIAVESDVAAGVQLHMTRMEEGIIRMRRVVDGIEVPAGGLAELKPGGFHVMLMGLKAPLEEGGSFPVTLTFERAGSVTIDVPVRAAGAMEEKMTHGTSHGN